MCPDALRGVTHLRCSPAVSLCVRMFHNVSQCEICVTVFLRVTELTMLGHGVKSEEITMAWKAVAALIQSKERREMSEVICLFTFLCAWHWSGPGTSTKLVLCVSVLFIPVVRHKAAAEVSEKETFRRV